MTDKDSSTRKTRTYFILVAIAVIIILLIFLAVVILVIFYFFFQSAESESPPPLNHFQYSEIDHSTNSTTFGFVTLRTELPKEGFITYRSKSTGNFIIISDFGGSSYECRGSCYCSTSSDRRSATTVFGKVLERGLYVVLSALTVGMASELAKESFRDECIQRFASDDTCDSPKVSSVVDSCQASPGAMNEGWDRTFLCEGECEENAETMMRHTSSEAEDAIANFFETKGHCEEFRMAKDIWVDCWDIQEDLECCNRARKKFIRIFLNDFCASLSVLEYMGLSQGGRKTQQRMQVCQAPPTDVLEKKFMADYVRCAFKSFQGNPGV